MTATASLGMYDGPALSAANDALWSLIAARLADQGIAGVPATLDRQRPLDAIWSDPGLLLAQCCGYPLVTRYRGGLRYLATPRYAATGCAGASYRSRIIVHADDRADRLADLRGHRAAVNQWHSNSGMNLFRAAVAPLAEGRPFFGTVHETGSHAASVTAVAAGDADVAAIDAVSFAHIARSDPARVARVRTIGWTGPAPGLPLVTSIATPAPVVRALLIALTDLTPSDEVRETLLIEGIERLPPGAYRGIARIEREAGRLGYPQLA